jgi:hypothetical protein
MEWPRKPIPPDHCGLFYKVAGSLHRSQLRGFDWQKHWLLTSSATSEYCGSYIVTGAVTSSLIWYRRFCNTWKWARCTPYPCTRNQMVWWNATSKRLRSTYGRSLRHTRGIGMQDYSSVFWLTWHPLTALQA